MIWLVLGCGLLGVVGFVGVMVSPLFLYLQVLKDIEGSANE